MALRKIRTQGDDILTKECRKVDKITPKIVELIDDMFETMYDTNGVGLAAPQVGILKQIVVIDTTGDDPIVLINPEIIETSGSQTGDEGCLSVPGMAGQVTRPNYVKVKAYNENMEEFILEERNFWREQSAMKRIIFMENFIQSLWKANFTAQAMRRMKNESSFYGDS